MKKLFTIALSLLMLLSCFAFSVSAEGEGVNVAKPDLGAMYVYNEGLSFGPVEGEEGFDDSACTRLMDGYIPVGVEAGGKTVGIVGTGATVILTIDLGKYYTDITDINFLCVCDSLTDGTSNRGFSGEDTKFKFSASGYEDTFERVKDFSMERVDLDGDEKTYFFNYNFKFDTPVAARFVEITMNAGKNPDTLAQGYVLSLGEIEIYSASGVEAEAPELPDVPSEDDPATGDESTVGDESVAGDNSTADNSSNAGNASTTDSKADESSTEASKANTASNASGDNGEEGGSNTVVIVVIIVVVVAAVVVVIVLMKNKKGQ